MRLLVAGGGFTDREGLFAEVAAVAARARRGQPDGLVALADRNGVVGTGFIRAGGFWRNLQLPKEAGALLGDGDVALDSGDFSTDATSHTGNAGSVSRDDVGVLNANASTALDRTFGGDTVVAASWVLAEVDLDAVSFDGHSARLCCGRIYAGNDNPL